MRFGHRIKELRSQKKLYLKEVAASTGMDIGLLSKIERGNRTARREQVIAFAKAYDQDPTELEEKWLIDKVVDIVYEHPDAIKILKQAIKELK